MKIRTNYDAKDTDRVEVGHIEPCPFCGKTSSLMLTNEKTYNGLVAENGSSLVKIVCYDCNAELTQYNIPENNYWFGIGTLVSRWNIRKG